jgi:hypothetical protein
MKLKEYARREDKGNKKENLIQGIQNDLEQQIREREELLLTLKDHITRIHNQITQLKSK